MENLEKYINKYQVTISFEISEEPLPYLEAHRDYINDQIEKHVIEYYCVSVESKRGWIIINAQNKQEVIACLQGSPLFKYWIYEIDELYTYDGQVYRLPSLQFN